MKRAWLLCVLLAAGPLLGACSYASLERQDAGSLTPDLSDTALSAG